MTLIEIILGDIALTYALFCFYVAVMNIKRVHDAGGLTPFALALSYPILIIGLLLDLLVNVLVMTFVFLEVPQELTVTSRLKRHYEEGSTEWRSRLAGWFKTQLDPFDPSGQHID